MLRFWLILTLLACPLTAVAQKPPPASRPHHPAPAPPPPAAATPPPVTPLPAAPPAPEEPAKGAVTGLPLPRFAALRSDEVNLRAGPGTRYQIEWIYRRRDLPVQIQREYEVWRLVSDMDGVKGWVHQATLAGRRTFIVSQGADQTLRRTAADSAAAVAILKPGVVGRILSCAAGGEWCEVQTGAYRGFLRRAAFWGTFPGEAVSN